jgi:predicted Zn-dependent protease
VVHVKDWVAEKTPAIRVPVAWEQPLGEAALTQMRSQVRFLSDPGVTEPLLRLAAPLFVGRTNATDRFTVLVTDSREVNAVALPGGFIVLHRGLLERARSAEEVQGVLAHEMAHVLKRHGVLQLAQNVGLRLLVQQLQGNENRLRDALIRDSGQLLGLKFSRDHERAADDLGWELLEQAEIDPGGMVNFFASLKADLDVPGTERGDDRAALLGTHPAPQERLDRLQQRRAAMGEREFKSFAAEFGALQEGLHSLFERPRRTSSALSLEKVRRTAQPAPARGWRTPGLPLAGGDQRETSSS